MHIRADVMQLVLPEGMSANEGSFAACFVHYKCGTCGATLGAADAKQPGAGLAACSSAFDCHLM